MPDPSGVRLGGGRWVLGPWETPHPCHPRVDRSRGLIHSDREGRGLGASRRVGSSPGKDSLLDDGVTCRRGGHPLDLGRIEVGPPGVPSPTSLPRQVEEGRVRGVVRRTPVPGPAWSTG